MCDLGGWVKTYRKSTKWQWYDSPLTAKIFNHCVLMANHKEGFWRGITIPRGSLATSYEKLALANGMSVQQTRTAINNLLSTGEITKQSTSKYTIISVSNYDIYQSSENDEQQTNNIQTTFKQQTNNKQITTNKNDKKNKNEEEYKNITTTTTTPPTEILKFNPKLFLNDYILKNHSRLYLEFPDLLNDSWHEKLINTYNQEDLIEALKQLNNKMKSGKYHCLGTTIETWTTTVQKSKQRNQFKGNPNEYNQKNIGNTAGSEYRTLPGGRVAANFTAEDYQSTWDG